MDGIIESLKARRAGIAAMLNPGSRSGSGSGLFLNSSSLQPQTVFRQMKASLSVKRPAMTALSLNAMSSFSKNAEMKYMNTQGLMHLRPSAAGGAPAVQREPAAMPLPVQSGAAAQPVSDLPASMSPIPPSPGISSVSYPPKSERRPVVFDRSDGPSDLEKRLMAAKKQKAEQAAKQRGPDRRKVRTERIEISSSDSKEVDREFVPFESAAGPQPPEPVKNGRQSAVSSQKTETVEPSAEIQREPLKAAGPVKSRMPSSVGSHIPVTDHSAAEVQREAAMPEEEPVESSQRSAADSRILETVKTIPVPETKTVRRETVLPEARPAEKPAPAAEMKSIRRETVLPEARPAEKPAPAAEVKTVQREPVLPEAKPAEKPAPAAEVKPIQRETVLPDVKPAEKPAPAAEVKSIQRETVLPKARPAEKSAPAAEVESIQREAVLPDARPAGKPAPAAEVKTVQRETVLPEARPEEKPAPAAEVKMIQRETVLPEAKPAEKPAPAAEMKTVQRETVKPEVKPAETSASTAEVKTVQREAISTEVKPADTSVPAAEMKTVQRETVKPEVKPAETPVPAAEMKTVQRETVKPEVKPAETPVPAAEMKTVQRETALPEARPADTPAAPAEMKTVQRETVLPEVRPAEKPVPTAEMKTVQRETVLPEAKPVDTPAAPTEMTTVQREIKLPEAKPAKSSRRSAAGSQLPLTDNLRAEVQREAAIPEAKPVKGSQPSAVSGHKKESEFQPQAAQEKSIQREMSPEQRAEFPAPSVSDKTVQRKMSPEQGAGGGSLSDLLKGLPTHYEMPKEQIEAIRSGRPYTGHSDAGKEPPTVSRELSDGIGKMSDPENRPEAGARNSGAGRAAAEAVVQNIIQREPDFVLPKHTNGPVSENQTSEPEVRREILSQPAASHSFSQTAGKLPGSGKTLPGSFGQKGLPGSTGAAPLNNGFFGGVTGLIQRESEDNGSPAPSPSEKASADQETGSDEAAEEKIHALFPEVTATQLDTLADKLVPRIKRMMRAEMERSVFR